MGCYLVKLLDSDHSHLFSFVNLRDIKANTAIKTCRYKRDRQKKEIIFFKGGNVVIMIRKTKFFPDFNSHLKLN